MRGRVEKARRGLVSAYPFGYRPVDREREADRPHGCPWRESCDRADDIRLACRRAAEHSIDHGGAAAPRPATAARRAWRPSMVRRVLTNRAYIGQASSSTSRSPCRPSLRSVSSSGAQEQLARNRALLAGRPSVVPFLLRGLLRCGSCDAPGTPTPRARPARTAAGARRDHARELPRQRDLSRPTRSDRLGRRRRRSKESRGAPDEACARGGRPGRQHDRGRSAPPRLRAAAHTSVIVHEEQVKSVAPVGRPHRVAGERAGPPDSTSVVLASRAAPARASFIRSAAGFLRTPTTASQTV